MAGSLAECGSRAAAEQLRVPRRRPAPSRGLAGSRVKLGVITEEGSAISWPSPGPTASAVTGASRTPQTLASLPPEDVNLGAGTLPWTPYTQSDPALAKFPANLKES